MDEFGWMMKDFICCHYNMLKQKSNDKYEKKNNTQKKLFQTV